MGATTNDPYLEWLCRKVWAVGQLNNTSYSRLAECLHTQAFRPVLNPLDQNRAMDGLQLRVIFMDKHGAVGSSSNRGPCTMLELLVALAQRMGFVMDRQAAVCFRDILKNLGLSAMTDEAWEKLNGNARTRNAMERVINRTYLPSGHGGLFPLNHSNEDQRTVDIWYQMQAWLMENGGDWQI